jgi:hypothetical protein
LSVTDSNHQAVMMITLDQPHRPSNPIPKMLLAVVYCDSAAAQELQPTISFDRDDPPHRTTRSHQVPPLSEQVQIDASR